MAAELGVLWGISGLWGSVNHPYAQASSFLPMRILGISEDVCLVALRY